MRPIVEVSGRANNVSTWRLEASSLKFLLKGNTIYERILPYSREIVAPQKELLKYILRYILRKIRKITLLVKDVTFTLLLQTTLF